MYNNLQKQLDPSWIAYKRGQGLVPQSGNWYYPKRWVLPEEFAEEWNQQGQGDWGKRMA